MPRSPALQTQSGFRSTAPSENYDLASYGLRSQTMTRHAREIAQIKGMRAAERGDIPMMIEAGASATDSTDTSVHANRYSAGNQRDGL